MITAVDTNIIIDILEPDPVFGPASRAALKSCFQDGSVIACEVVWAEVATAYASKIEAAVDVMRRIGIEYSAMTLEATLEAAKRWSIFRKKTKARDRIVADFLVGGHAIALSDRLLTRDRGFYRDYFKPLKIKIP